MLYYQPTVTKMIFNLFNIFALFYAFRSLQIARIVWLDWGTIRGPSFTSPLKRLADQASFFLAVPVAVFFHEGAHALATWLFGGRVEEFGYRVFWGYVLPSGDFTLAQDWFISLAGTLGSLVFGLLVWLVLRRNPSPTLRFFALRAFRYQIFFSLIYYPVFTLLGFYGDWRTIYNFKLTPVLSSITAAVHAGLLVIFFQLDRQGWFEMPVYESAAQQEELQALKSQTVANPQDTQAQLKLIEAYRQSGSARMAMQQAQAFVKANPNSAEGHLQLAAIQAHDKRQVPSRARDSAAKAINLGLSNPAGLAYANQLLGQYSLGVHKVDEAITYFERGIEAAHSAGRPGMEAYLNFQAAMSYRRKGQYQAAYGRIQQAIELSHGQDQAMSLYREELETIKTHAGWPTEP